MIVTGIIVGCFGDWDEFCGIGVVGVCCAYVEWWCDVWEPWDGGVGVEEGC